MPKNNTMDDCSPLPLRFRRTRPSTCSQSQDTGRTAPPAGTAAPWRPAGSQKAAVKRSSGLESTASMTQSSRPSSRGALHDCTHTINLQAPRLSTGSSRHHSQLPLDHKRRSSQNAGSNPATRSSTVEPAAAATHRQRAVCLQVPGHAPSSRYQMHAVRSSGAGQIFKSGTSSTQQMQGNQPQHQTRLEQQVDVNACDQAARHSMQQGVDVAQQQQQQQQQDHQIMLLQRQLADLCLQQQAVLQKYAAACAPCLAVTEGGAAAACGSPDVEPRRGLVPLAMQRRAGLVSLERGSSPVASSPAVMRSRTHPGAHRRDSSSASSWTGAQLQLGVEQDMARASHSSSDSDMGSGGSPLSTPRTPAATSPELLVAQAAQGSSPRQGSATPAVRSAPVAAAAAAAAAAGGQGAAGQAPPAHMGATADGGSSDSCSEAWHPGLQLRGTARAPDPTLDPLLHITRHACMQAQPGSGSDSSSQAPRPRHHQVHSGAAAAGISLRRSTTLRAAVARALQVRQVVAPHAQAPSQPSSEARLDQAAGAVQGPGAWGAPAAVVQQGETGACTSGVEPAGGLGVPWQQVTAHSSSCSTRAMPSGAGTTPAAGATRTAAAGWALQQARASTSPPATASSSLPATAAATAARSRRAAVTLGSPAEAGFTPSGSASPAGSGSRRQPHYLAGLAHLRAQQDAAFQAMAAYHLTRGAAGRGGSSTSGSGRSSACSSAASTPKAGGHHGGVSAASLAWAQHSSTAAGTWADAGLLAEAAVRASPTTTTCSRLRPPPPARSARASAEHRPSPGRLVALPDSQPEVAPGQAVVGQAVTPRHPAAAGSSWGGPAGQLSNLGSGGRDASASSRTMTEFMLDVQAARSPAGAASSQQRTQHTLASSRQPAGVCPGVAAAQRNLDGVLSAAAAPCRSRDSSSPQGHLAFTPDPQQQQGSSIASTLSGRSSSPGSPDSDQGAGSPGASPLRPLQLQAALLDVDLLRGVPEHSASPWQLRGGGWVVHTNWAAMAAEGAPATATATGWQPMTAAP